MSIDFTGFDELEKELRRLERNAKELSQTTEVTFNELFTAAFMNKHTSYSSIDELLDAGGFDAKTSEEFEKIPEEALDQFVSKVTSFSTWEEMLSEATSEYAARKLGF